MLKRKGVYEGTRGRKRLHRCALFVQCWPLLVDWLSVQEVSRMALTCKDHHEYSKHASRAWPSKLVIRRHDIQFPSRGLCFVLSACSPGEKRITVDYQSVRVYEEDFDHTLEVTNPIFSELQRLQIDKLKLGFSRFPKGIFPIVLCKYLCPKQLDYTYCQGSVKLLIECLDERTEVLDLSGSGLLQDKSPLRPFVGLCVLDQLRSLNLSGINLVDNTTLRVIQHLPKLTDLDLSYCRKITSYQHLNLNLRKLNLSYCGKVEDPIGLGRLSQLQQLNVGHCMNLEFEEYGARIFPQLTQLKELNLASNFYLFDVNQLLSDSIESLDLDLCFRVDVQSLTSVLRRLTKLRVLNIQCGIETIQPETLGSISPGLESLKCSFTNENISFEHLRHLTRLRTLNCDVHRSMDGASLQQIVPILEHLTYLELHGCDGMVDVHLTCLREAQRLETLYMVNCNKLGDALFVNTLSQLGQLHTLRIQGSNVSEKGIQSLSALRRLKKLDVSESYSLKGDALQYIPGTVTSLDISMCYSIGDASIDYIYALSNLRRLIVTDYEQFTPESLEMLRRDRIQIEVCLDDED